MKKYFFLFVLFLFFPFVRVHAEALAVPKIPTQVRATITQITSVLPMENGLTNFDFHAAGQSGEQFDVSTEDSTPNGIPVKLVVGDKIFLQKINTDPPHVYFEDVQRTSPLIWIGIIFVLLTLVVGLRRGVSSIIGLVITLFVMFGYIFPSILHGGNVITVTVIGSIIILAVNMHITHGFRKESFFAFLSTIVGFLCVLLFAYIFSAWTKLSGTGTEEAILFVSNVPVHFTTVKLFLAGVILGAVGVLDDIAISQTEIVHELVMMDPTLSRKELFFRSMRIGRHHIASTVNTLVLVYAGASLPILLLFLSHSGDASAFLNSEAVTEEIVRTIAGTSALILTVPAASLIATFAYRHKSLDSFNKKT